MTHKVNGGGWYGGGFKDRFLDQSGLDDDNADEVIEEGHLMLVQIQATAKRIKPPLIGKYREPEIVTRCGQCNSILRSPEATQCAECGASQT